ncbi:TB2/DP1, HVA22 family-domain-containing protein [Achaetomium macrosporum]|uniref:Protein YOP1 n=1 Tax=Achaetomium macrosporum TaxID=79813 RepID=A0AAN7CAC3_9PEZI|nr:TB2/DP1, HVA22 family-domain-containing protein [Achaetomium macrosporum]
MFDIFAKLLSSIASFLFPLFASYKALKTSDPSQLTPWLMYWVVLACVLLVESWTEWILFWVPFYAYIRLLFLLYLVLPQTQGARLIYEEHIHPRLEENEKAIEEFIASAHARLRSAGIDYLKRAIELLKTNVLGLPPSPEPAAAPEPQTAQSYTQSLLARFTLPTPKWATTTPAPGAAPGATGLTSDFYNLLASAVSAAATTFPTSTTRPSTSAPETESGSGSIIPETIRTASATARMSFIRAQRERLRIVMSALDREEADAVETARHQEEQQQQQQQSQGLGLGVGGQRKSLSEQSVGSTSGLSLSKSRSEGDFEKLEAFSSGAEEEDLDFREDVDVDATPVEGVRKRGGGQGWIPWAWGGGGGSGGGAESGRSSGMEK